MISGEFNFTVTFTAEDKREFEPLNQVFIFTCRLLLFIITKWKPVGSGQFYA